VTDEEGLVEVWVELGRAYALLRRVDVHTAVNASTWTDRSKITSTPSPASDRHRR
jgi:hypothetical protein